MGHLEAAAAAAGLASLIVGPLFRASVSVNAQLHRYRPCPVFLRMKLSVCLQAECPYLFDRIIEAFLDASGGSAPQ